MSAQGHPLHPTGEALKNDVIPQTRVNYITRSTSTPDCGCAVVPSPLLAPSDTARQASKHRPEAQLEREAIERIIEYLESRRARLSEEAALWMRSVGL